MKKATQKCSVSSFVLGFLPVLFTVVDISSWSCAAFSVEADKAVQNAEIPALMRNDGTNGLFDVTVLHNRSVWNNSLGMEKVGGGLCAENTEAKDAIVQPSASEDTQYTLHERFGVKQRAEGAEEKRTLRIIEESIVYMREEVMVKPQYESIRHSCRNFHDLCAFWAGVGECQRNSSFMALKCAPSCKLCHLHAEPRSDTTQRNGAGNTDENDKRVERFGVRQRVDKPEAKQTERVSNKMIKYMEEEVFVQQHFEEARSTCVNKHELCAFWASIGECQKHHMFLRENCAPACKLCHMYVRDFKEERFGVKQRIDGDGPEAEKTRLTLSLSVAYMDEVVMVKPRYDSVRAKCQNKRDLCAFWASLGQCNEFRWFMTNYCAPACRLCLLMGSDKRANLMKTSFREDREKKRLTLPVQNNTNAVLAQVMGSIADGTLSLSGEVSGSSHSF